MIFRVILPLALFLLVLTFWTRGRIKTQNEAVKWVESNGGKVVKGPYPWIESCPSFLQTSLNAIAGEVVYEVNLESCKSKDISQLLQFMNCEILNLANSEIEDISLLVQFTQLVDVNISGTSISDISPLEHSLDLETLNLSETRITSFEPLSQMKNLKNLNLKFTNFSDLSLLENSRKLERIDFSYSLVKQVLPLSKILSLKCIKLIGQEIEKSEFLKVKEALPNCYFVGKGFRFENKTVDDLKD